MWSYYGSKTNLVDYYPTPKYDKIIEPFAGSARYALKYWEKDVLLVDKYETIVNIWKWLQKCSSADIKSLPRLEYSEALEDLIFDCQEAKDLYGFLCGFSNKRPRKTASKKLIQRPNFMNYRLEFIGKNIHKIKHWEIQHGSYEKIPNQKATWFIDPPYNSKAGLRYVHNAKEINYKKLAEWSINREGQVIVCEGGGADWLPFKPMAIQKTNKKMVAETIWTNQPSAFDNLQNKLDL